MTEDDRKRRAQGLTSICAHRRHKLLQGFARIEIALAKSDKFTTFGQLLKSWIEEDRAERKRFEELVAIRNLIAHAFVEIVQGEDGPKAVWTPARSAGASNARIMTDSELADWSSAIVRRQEELLLLLKS
jgi:hypothetical protein